MGKLSKLFGIDGLAILSIGLLLIVGVSVLRTVYPSLFPSYFIYIFIAVLIFFFFWKIDFEILLIFSKHTYVLSILLLLLPLIIGQVSRGVIRWIPIGSLTVQPSEIVRPFLFLFFANNLIKDEIDLKSLIKSFFAFLVPFCLILIQPSLGVASLTAVGYVGILLSSAINKKQIFAVFIVGLMSIPAIWFILAPYQKARISGFLNPETDPLGIGYNSIQSMISVGSGGLMGRGLGKGVQTQLSFLPERHTDFIFASISEELGFIGAGTVIFLLLIFFLTLVSTIERARSPVARAFISASVLSLLAETFIHLGMNMGLLPITGVPLPFVSAGGSALLGTVATVAIVLNAKK